MLKTRLTSCAGWAVLLLATSVLAQGQDERTRVFDAPVDRVWTVTRSTLKSFGWEVDKEDKQVGWLLTDSRRLEGDDFGVYAKGTKNRLRVVLKSVAANKTSVTIERRVWKEERILWMDKDEEIKILDRSLEKEILDAIGAAI
ncbi:MAG TPA: hypothetical protein VEL75_06125 [Candidatus Methylomirabilis sp.]|nr:hypothetical protein [Candidatus Methylomirabilis sp.]